MVRIAEPVHCSKNVYSLYSIPARAAGRARTTARPRTSPPRYTAGVMETAAAWVRKALKAEGKVTACI